MFSFRLLGLALVFVPRIAEWVLHLQKDYLLRLTSYLYLFLVYGIGMIFNGYDRIPLYDKVMHTLTGVVFGLCGLIAFYFLKPKQNGKSWSARRSSGRQRLLPQG